MKTMVALMLVAALSWFSMAHAHRHHTKTDASIMLVGGLHNHNLPGVR